MSEVLAEVDALRSALERRDDVRLCYIFGSVASGRAGRASDVDVAVLLVDEPTPRTLDHLTEDLEEATGRPVDLVDLATAAPSH